MLNLDSDDISQPNDFKEILILGRGSYSVVYKVLRLADNQEYAMKKVKLPRTLCNETQNTLNEVRLMASLKHKNLVSFHDTFFDNHMQHLCIVMELCNYGDFFQQIEKYARQRRYMTENFIWQVIIGVCQGLKVLHYNKIVHRDIKSANIMLNRYPCNNTSSPKIFPEDSICEICGDTINQTDSQSINSNQKNKKKTKENSANNIISEVQNNQVNMSSRSILENNNNSIPESISNRDIYSLYSHDNNSINKYQKYKDIDYLCTYLQSPENSVNKYSINPKSTPVTFKENKSISERNIDFSTRVDFNRNLKGARLVFADSHEFAELSTTYSGDSFHSSTDIESPKEDYHITSNIDIHKKNTSHENNKLIYDSEDQQPKESIPKQINLTLSMSIDTNLQRKKTINNSPEVRAKLRNKNQYGPHYDIQKKSQDNIKNTCRSARTIEDKELYQVKARRYSAIASKKVIPNEYQLRNMSYDPDHYRKEKQPKKYSKSVKQRNSLHRKGSNEPPMKKDFTLIGSGKCITNIKISNTISSKRSPKKVIFDSEVVPSDIAYSIDCQSTPHKIHRKPQQNTNIQTSSNKQSLVKTRKQVSITPAVKPGRNAENRKVLPRLSRPSESNILCQSCQCDQYGYTIVAKIGDLNISKIAKTGMLSTQTGTPYYASPEVWKDQCYDYKADIWSIGCVFYEAAVLRPPFSGGDMRELYENIIKAEFTPIPQHYSKHMHSAINALLQTDPSQRPTVSNFLEFPFVKANNVDYVSEPIQENISLMDTIRLPQNESLWPNALPRRRYDSSTADT